MKFLHVLFAFVAGFFCAALLIFAALPARSLEQLSGVPSMLMPDQSTIKLSALRACVEQFSGAPPAKLAQPAAPAPTATPTATPTRGAASQATARDQPATNLTALPARGAEQPPAAPPALLLDKSAIPTLTVIGCSKCGSTDVWNHLVKGTGGFQAGKSKEIMCLNKGGFKEIRACYQRHFGALPPGTKTIDGGPTYFHLYDRHTQQDDELSAIKFGLFTPNTAILLVLRDPVAALRSQFNWNKKANGGLHAWKHADVLGTQIEMELQYLSSPGPRGLLESLLGTHGPWTPRAYRQLADDYHFWLAGEPSRCAQVGSLQDPRHVSGRAPPSWCYTWPLIIERLYCPLVAQWQAAAFRPHRAAIVQSEAYFQDRSVLNSLFGLPAEARGAGRGIANKAQYGDSADLSPSTRSRLQAFFAEHNRRFRQLLQALQNESVIVVPSPTDPKAWWTTGS